MIKFREEYLREYLVLYSWTVNGLKMFKLIYSIMVYEKQVNIIFETPEMELQMSL